jgi:ABC-2 type transport system permease protein
MTTLIYAEWYKILRSRALAIILAGVVAFTVLQVYDAYSSQEPVLGQNGIMEMGQHSWLLSIWFAAFVGYFVASEFPNGTIRNVLALGKNRTCVYLSKVFSACIAVSAMITAVGIVATVGFSMVFGFGDMGLGEFLSFFISSLTMQLLYYLTYATIFGMLAFLSKSPIMTVLLGIGYQFLKLSLAEFLENYAGGRLEFAVAFLPQNYFAYISAIDAFRGDPALITRGALVSAAYMVLACIVGIAVFKRSDIS